MEKRKRTVTIEVEVDEHGNLSGVEIRSEGMTLLEIVGILEISKSNIIKSQVKKESWSTFKK